MSNKAKLITIDGHQAVLLPDEFRIQGEEAHVYRDPNTGDLVLSPSPESWEQFFARCDAAEIPKDFMSEADRSQGLPSRDPFEGWQE